MLGAVGLFFIMTIMLNREFRPLAHRAFIRHAARIVFFFFCSLRPITCDPRTRLLSVIYVPIMRSVAAECLSCNALIIKRK